MGSGLRCCFEFNGQAPNRILQGIALSTTRKLPILCEPSRRPLTMSPAPHFRVLQQQNEILAYRFLFKPDESPYNGRDHQQGTTERHPRSSSAIALQQLLRCSWGGRGGWGGGPDAFRAFRPELVGERYAAGAFCQL